MSIRGYRKNGPPVVAGVIALMKSANPDLTPGETRRIIIETVYAAEGFPGVGRGGRREGGIGEEVPGAMKRVQIGFGSLTLGILFW